MGDDPFVAVFVSPEFCTGHVEAPPPDPPFCGVSFAICFGDERLEYVGVFIHEGEPGVGGFFVVLTRDLPVVIYFEVVLEVEEEVVGGHLSTREKVASHPIGFVFRFIVVGVFMVGEDVDEELSTGF